MERAQEPVGTAGYLEQAGHGHPTRKGVVRGCSPTASSPSCTGRRRRQRRSTPPGWTGGNARLRRAGTSPPGTGSTPDSDVVTAVGTGCTSTTGTGKTPTSSPGTRAATRRPGPLPAGGARHHRRDQAHGAAAGHWHRRRSAALKSVTVRDSTTNVGAGAYSRGVPPADDQVPVIVIREPECNTGGARTFVMFERLPWCRRCFLARAGRP
jgi:hypothetical protein